MLGKPEALAMDTQIVGKFVRGQVSVSKV
jgi:hypothetical protein